MFNVFNNAKKPVMPALWSCHCTVPAFNLKRSGHGAWHFCQGAPQLARLDLSHSSVYASVGKHAAVLMLVQQVYEVRDALDVHFTVQWRCIDRMQRSQGFSRMQVAAMS